MPSQDQDNFDQSPPPKPMKQLSLFVTLDGYEGPIDLLLDLVREQKIDLREIAILPLAEQYLEFISSAQNLDIEIAADYLVMAAILAYLKSKLLLPDSDPEEDEETIDLAEVLKLQLMKLESMRAAAKQLMALPRLGYERFAGVHHQQFGVGNRAIHTATLYDLLAAYGRVAKTSDHDTLTITESQLYTVEGALERISQMIKTRSGWNDLLSFLPHNLASSLDRRSALAAHFGASLEMVRDGKVKIRQDQQFGKIYLKTADKSAEKTAGRKQI